MPKPNRSDLDIIYKEQVSHFREPLRLLSPDTVNDWNGRTTYVALIHEVALVRLFETLEGASAGKVRIYLGGRDFPIHVTIQEAYGSSSIDTMSSLSKYDIHGTICFNRLILSKDGVIFLASTSVPDWLHERRNQARKFMTSIGLKTKELPIVHATLARFLEIKNFPEDVLVWKRVCDLLNSRLEKEPLTLSITGIYAGPSPIPGTKKPLLV